MTANGKSSAFSTKTPRRIFPTISNKHETTTPLSILDASVAKFAACSAIWFFDAEPLVDAREPALFRSLELSFRETLSRWPHWSGQLRWAVETDGLSTPHLGRPVITYGGNSDVGVDWTVATCDTELSSMIPSREARTTTDRVWKATNLPCELQTASKLAFSDDLANFKGLPGLAVQLTAFECGGWSVHVKLTHCLSDAQSLLTFMHAWAAQSRKSESILSQPVFDPEMLNRHAGALERPDPEMVAKARALPMHRFDWWATDAPGYPDWALPSSAATMPTLDVLETQQLKLSPSTHPPWPTWNISLPVEHVQITFSAAEVSRMKDAARHTLPAHLSEQRISRLDSLLSHVWMLINRARGRTEDNVYLDITLGLRNRLSPPLASGFVGSPLLLSHIVKAGVDASAGPIGHIAGEIRSSLARFTPESVSAYIHDAALEVSPQRLWQAFLGSQHTLVTSWTQMKAYEVHFGSSDATIQARYVQGVMPRMDGLVQVMDLGDSGAFDISLNLEKNAMLRLLKDPQLRAFA